MPKNEFRGTYEHCENKDLLYIDFTPIVECNQNCPYCYNNYKQFKTCESSAWDKETCDKTIEKLNLIPNEMIVQILGGEPTIWKNLNYFITGLCSVKNIKQVYIVTNGSKKLDFIEHNPKLMYMLTVHPLNGNFSRIIENAHFLKSEKRDFRMKIMCHQTELARAKTEEFIDLAEKEGLLDYLFSAYCNLENTRMEAPFWKPTRIESEMKYISDGEIIDEHEICKLTWNATFIGWNCVLNAVHVMNNGFTYIGCLDKRGFNFWSCDVSRIKPIEMRCHAPACSNNCAMCLHKYK